MRKNDSPWLRQLSKDRPVRRLTEDLRTDVAIVGAGIAGISTAFFLLKYTGVRIALLEATRFARGATGHNAGQVTSYFERGLASLAQEFGLPMAAEGQRAVESAWSLLDEMYTDAGLDIPFSRFTGHAGLSSIDQLLWHLKNNALRKKSGLNTEEIRVADEPSIAGSIPGEYAELWSAAPKKEILSLLQTETERFIASVSYQKGCINSALFCQEVLAFLERAYPERFMLYEDSPIEKLVLKSDHALLDAGTRTVNADKVILCTNGFESLRIINETGLDIDARYHHLISGKIGYMSGYLEEMNKPPTAISYFTDASADGEASYYYLTRRSYEHERGVPHNLISIGGPDADLPEGQAYSPDAEYPEATAAEIDAFVRGVYDTDPNKTIDYAFTWHGLMGYTKNRVRMIGPEPQNPVLLYNLGCNGVGILPSLYGGRKIARHIGGETVEPSIFDVPRRA